MSPLFAIEHGVTSILGMIILGTITYGTWRFGFARMFVEPFGRVVKILSIIDFICVIIWMYYKNIVANH